IPSFGVKQQAVPGRTAAVWFKADKVGVYHGQCSVLCGKLHSMMPIVVHVVEQEVYDKWMAALQAKDKKGAGAILKADASLESVFKALEEARAKGKKGEGKKGEGKKPEAK
ncbi:MAG: hypothetical protein ORN22_09825, partial [Opitutales bacterium]|nr:hypothetical protein [Opitutales bacterium]